MERTQTAAVAFFPSQLGWFGVFGSGGTLRGLTFGHTSESEVRASLRARTGETGVLLEADWAPELRRRLQAYARGTAEDFSDIRIEQPPRQSEFQQRVIDSLRLIRYGLTVTYAELARLAGAPGAARAVGRIMATNPVPIVVPCHRVLAHGGRLGGYSAPRGVAMKQHLLEMEGQAAGTIRAAVNGRGKREVHV